jgi:hypothetical protein
MPGIERAGEVAAPPGDGAEAGLPMPTASADGVGLFADVRFVFHS